MSLQFFRGPGDAEEEAERGVFGEAGAPNSIVAISSDARVAARSAVVMVALLEPTGAPQEEQKRPVGGNSAPQSAQVYTFFSADSVLVLRPRDL